MKKVFILLAALISLVACQSSDSGPNSNQAGNAIDITNLIFTNTASNCAAYVNQYKSNVKDIGESKTFTGNLKITAANGKCVFATNSIPNHDFNDGASSFVNRTSSQNGNYSVSQSPEFAAITTPLSLGVDNAIFLNGVKLDLLAAGCFDVRDGKIGCHDLGQPFRYDPMSPLTSFGTDSHNAHTQPDGSYHYHGNPMAMFSSDDNSKASPVIGFAADGFPIYGSYFDDNGTIKKAKSSYRLKKGTRKARTYKGEVYTPDLTYDGIFIDDNEYLAELGDLDQCNGMEVNGSYGYYVTDSYPWVLGCFKGTPDSSFNKKR